jgi:hypothetical protein
MRILQVADGPIYHLAYAPDGKSLVIQDGEIDSGQQEHIPPVRAVRWWSWPGGVEEHVWEVGGPVTFSPDHGLAVAMLDPEEWEWDVYDGRTLQRVPEIEGPGGWVEFGFSHDSRWLMQVKRNSASSPICTAVQMPRSRWITPVARPENAAPVSYLPGWAVFAAGGDSAEVVVAPGDEAGGFHFDEEDERFIILPPDEWSWIRRTLFLDEHTVLSLGVPVTYSEEPSTSGPGRGAVWDIPSRSMKLALGGHTDRITDLALTADRQSLASAGLDGQVIFRDTATWSIRKSYAWDLGPLHAVAVAPDGQTCAAGSADGRVVVWDVTE